MGQGSWFKDGYEPLIKWQSMEAFFRLFSVPFGVCLFVSFAVVFVSFSVGLVSLSVVLVSSSGALVSYGVLLCRSRCLLMSFYCPLV